VRVRIYRGSGWACTTFRHRLHGPELTSRGSRRAHVTDMFDMARLSTIHPAVVHLPLGVIPLMLFAYVVATVRRSPAWGFTADVALWFSVVVVTIAAAFGYVSYFTLSWPGGLEPWPQLHLALGTITTLAVWSLGAFRWRASRRARGVATQSNPSIDRRWSFAALGITVLALATGYIGGEILVFHAGMAVRAGGNGALAPPMSLSNVSPTSVYESMERLRPLWARNMAAVGRAVVNRPGDLNFATVSDDAARIGKLARWLDDWGNQPSKTKNGVSDEHRAFAREASKLEQSASQLADAARREDLSGVIAALGEITQRCAECHAEHRWKQPVARASTQQ
jgi:uncharacterized membrane protein